MTGRRCRRMFQMPMRRTGHCVESTALEFLDFSETEVAVHGGAHYFDRTVSLQDLRNQFPHERGIVHHQNAHRCHGRTSVAPAAAHLRSARESRIPETTPLSCSDLPLL